MKAIGERNAGKLHVAFDEGRQGKPVVYSILKTVKVLRKRTSFAEHDAVLAFDTTDEDFYGHPETMWIHNWTGEDAVTGKFRFLTCSLVSHDVPEKVPLFSL